jgi:hypothetical protein
MRMLVRMKLSICVAPLSISNARLDRSKSGFSIKGSALAMGFAALAIS